MISDRASFLQEAEPSTKLGAPLRFAAELTTQRVAGSREILPSFLVRECRLAMIPTRAEARGRGDMNAIVDRSSEISRPDARASERFAARHAAAAAVASVSMEESSAISRALAESGAARRRRGELQPKS
jgi:hypothetical protein